MGRFDQFIGTELARGTWTWSSDEAMLYAIGVGVGQDDPTVDLQFTTENTKDLPQQVLPTFLTLATPGKQLWLRPLGFKEREWTAGWPDGMVHGEQGITINAPIPTTSAADVSLILKGVYDKGSGALVVVDTNVTVPETGILLGTARAGYFIRGQGGFGGPRGPAEERIWTKPNRDPDVTVVQRTALNQSLIYRLSRDRNPHCTDPARAREDGFEKPIFQGLGTYGFAGRALLSALCNGEVKRFGGMYARLSQPVIPGDTLQTRIWRTETGAQFQTFASDTRLVLDHGSFTYAGR